METTIIRGEYGQIEFPHLLGKTAVRAEDILKQAIKQNKLDAPFCDIDNKHRGYALNYDLYDFAPGVALVQKRLTKATKHGNSPKKDYLILVRNKGKIHILDGNRGKTFIVRMANKCPTPGAIIRRITGERTASRVLARAVAARMGAVK